MAEQACSTSQHHGIRHMRRVLRPALLLRDACGEHGAVCDGAIDRDPAGRLDDGSDVCGGADCGAAVRGGPHMVMHMDLASYLRCVSLGSRVESVYLHSGLMRGGDA